MLPFFLTFVRFFRALARSWRYAAFRASFFLALTILATGTIFYHSVEGWDWIDSIYFSVATVSTVGYGDLAPKTDFGKIFTIFYIFVGVGVFVAMFSQIARALLRNDENEPDDRPN